MATEVGPLKATHGSRHNPLRIGELEIGCYVLEDGTRVITQRGIQKAVSMKGRGNSFRLAEVVERLAVRDVDLKIKIDARDLIHRLSNPIEFIPPSGAALKPAYGYAAGILPDLCVFVLECRDADLLSSSQGHYAIAADLLLRAFAQVGIIALVDEATGYQAERDRNELHKILEKYIVKELLPWSKRFPDEFYQEIFRLRGWRYTPMSASRPSLVGKITNRFVYEKLPPGVLDELRSRNPRIANGRRAHKHHQFLTEDIGNAHLEKHLVAVTTLMRISSTWEAFERNFQRAFPSLEPVQEVFDFFEEDE